jgi:hypothetical protein
VKFVPSSMDAPFTGWEGASADGRIQIKVVKLSDPSGSGGQAVWKERSGPVGKPSYHYFLEETVSKHSFVI